MFFIFSKQKIYTYLISIITVLLLFCVADALTADNKAIQASSSLEKMLPIYNVKTEEHKVSLTMNCAW